MTVTTAYQSQYYAYELTKQNASDSVGRLSQSLISATVDLNPHQVEAALFAFRAPLERGALLADEVGLGKTIEAGLVLSQLWAERKRQILIIVPPPLRKQWNRELIEKFYIPSIILESKNYSQFVKEGSLNPFFQKDQVVIVSHTYARNKAQDIQRITWDLIVIDEAHRLRNVYKKSNKVGRVIREATAGFPKLLLTATPLQNSLMELYGLMSFIDPYLFGDETTFRKQFGSGSREVSQSNLKDLKERIAPVCHRTLRRQVVEYVPYTKRIPLLQEFESSEKEWELYVKVSDYLQEDEIVALPRSQRSLMTLVVRKILASSSFAISDTLQSLIKRLDSIIEGENLLLNNNFIDDIDEIEDTVEEWEDEGTDEDEVVDSAIVTRAKKERERLVSYYELAQSITENAKGQALLTALSTGFNTLNDLGANEKAVIFTESRRTQNYLKEMLEQNGYEGKVVIFNGTNNSDDIKEIYAKWLEKHQHDDQITGSKQVDTRAAIVEYFKEEGSIMIATESAAEGINLQFCSLVVNYDLPWNPQRIEQRIGRCHRYGQKHDVVVINFLNGKNAADKRVYELLSDKFSLFNGVFGSSDEVLGSLESGVDFEKRIQQIYQTCRTSEEIQQAFNELQQELDGEIQEKMMETRKSLLKNFDDEVCDKLRNQYEQTSIQMSKMERYLWGMSLYEGRNAAKFDQHSLSFVMNDTNEKYQLISQAKKLDNEKETVHYYRLGHPIAEKWLAQAKRRELPIKEITFNYSAYEGKVSILSSLVGQTGWLSLDVLKVQSSELEEHLVFSAVDEDGNQIDQESCEKLFELPADEYEVTTISTPMQNTLQLIYKHQKEAILNEIQEKATIYLDRELEKLDKWSKDLKGKLELDLKEIDIEIAQLQKEARITRMVREKLEMNKLIQEKERKRNEMRRNLYDEQDEIDRQKQRLFIDMESRLEQKISEQKLFIIKWSVI